jgi:hypothetical protein
MFLPVLVLAALGPVLRGDEDEVSKRQKEKGQELCKRILEGDPFVQVESDNFLMFASKPVDEKQAKALSENLEANYATARKGLRLDEKKALWPGKLSVYLFGERRMMNSLIRAVEKKRPQDVGLGSYFVKGEAAHIVACAPMSKDDPAIEAQALQQLFSVILARVAGENNGIPEWFIQGFMDATAWRSATDEAGIKQREALKKKALALVNGKTPRGAKELFAGTLSGDELVVIRGSVLEFMAYGPESDKFPDLLKAFKVEENRQKSIDDVLVSIDSNQTKFSRHWVSWVRTGK